MVGNTGMEESEKWKTTGLETIGMKILHRLEHRKQDLSTIMFSLKKCRQAHGFTKLHIWGTVILTVHVGPIFWQQAPPFLRLSHLPARTATQLLPRAYAKEAKTRALSGCFISYEINAEAQYSKGKELPIPPFQTVMQTSFPPFSVPPIFLWSSFDPNGA
jgi:hypothetical protein